MAVKTLGLHPAARFVLEQLVGFYRGEPISGRMLVWPSNELLQDRTGLSERMIRYAVRELIELGAIVAKDSANGKRYARRSPQGQILDAFGFDLSPLITRADEFKQRHDALKDLERERKGQYDQVTIYRRQIAAWLTEAPNELLEDRYDGLAEDTPRRTSRQPLGGLLALWEALHDDVREHYASAKDGNDCRHKDINNDAPDQSCEQSHEGVAGAKPGVELEDLVEATPNAWRWGRVPGDLRELVREAGGELRGAVGVHHSAWEEAVEKIGPVAAAAAMALVIQHDLDGQKSGKMIKSPGGYFRTYTRLVAEGRIDLVEEIARFKRKRHN